MKRDSKYGWWSLVFFIVFILVSYIVFYLVTINGSWYSPTLFETVIIILGSFRLTRLFVYDSITSVYRNSIITNSGKGGLWTLLSDIVSCPWCAGIWMTLVSVVLFYLTPFTTFLLYVAALAGLATLIQLFANLTGWKAERNKQKALKKD
ncbi:MAG: DUF1360 domain-containing protein [Candidatus Campbellbacteria bacterium]|nr:DUF1360 domain-containing protein [Candidatus Campbellbacteria bacterium]